MGFPEDYSQYKPRGHYTINSDLARYFKAMMWYGRRSFTTKSDTLTLQALLLTHLLNRPENRDLWKNCTSPRSSLLVNRTTWAFTTTPA